MTREPAVLAHAEPRPAARPPGPLSIVVCTRDRPEDLARCLAALAPMAEAGHEVLVVDNAPARAPARAAVASFGYRYLLEPEPGLDRARNRGLRAASHDIVAYADDDTVPHPGWADALATALTEAATAGGATGLVLPLELGTRAQQRFERYCAGRRVLTPRVFAAPGLRPAAAGVVGMGANMAVRRDLAVHLGGFDPRLDAGTATSSGGDTDMFARILETGAPIVYAPSALVWHRHRRTEEDVRRCVFGYGVGLFAFLTKRLVERRDAHAAVIAIRWWLGPLAKIALRRARGRPAPPVSLALCEAAGALLGPWRLWQETRRAARHPDGAEAAR